MMSFLFILLGIIISIIDYRIFTIFDIYISPNIIGYIFIFIGLVKKINYHIYFKLALFITIPLIILSIPAIIPSIILSDILIKIFYILTLIFNVILWYFIFYGVFELAQYSNINNTNVAETGFILNLIFMIYQYLLIKHSILLVGYFPFIITYIVMLSSIIRKFNIILKK